MTDPLHSAESGRGVEVLSVPSEDALFDFLSALNWSGIHPELPCSTRGRAFLAGLTEPDADHVHILATDGDSGTAHCCECAHPGEPAGEWDVNSWEPPYPVLALVTEWPDLERCREDEIDPWWTRVTPPGEG